MSKVYKTPFMVNMPNEVEEIELMAVGDFHIGDRFFSEQILNDIKTWVKVKKNRFITINGDVFNTALKTSVSDIYSEVMNLDECIDYFSDFIDQVGADKILCITSGNHDQRLWREAGVDPLRYICSVKGVNYAPDEAFITLKLGHHNNTEKKVTYRIYMTHGAGGGGTAGAKINKLMKMSDITSNADVYLMAHVHDPIAKPTKVYEFSSQGNAIVEQTRWFVVSGSCLDRGGYSVTKMFPPVCTWSPVLTLSGVEKKIKVEMEA